MLMKCKRRRSIKIDGYQYISHSEVPCGHPASVPNFVAKSQSLGQGNQRQCWISESQVCQQPSTSCHRTESEIWGTDWYPNRIWTSCLSWCCMSSNSFIYFRYLHSTWWMAAAAAAKVADCIKWNFQLGDEQNRGINCTEAFRKRQRWLKVKLWRFKLTVRPLEQAAKLVNSHCIEDYRRDVINSRTQVGK